MADTKTFVADAPAWIDLSTTDKAASRDFYSKLFGWKIEVGGPDTFEYGMAKIGNKFVAGIGGTQENAPSAWMVYIGTRDADAVAKKVEAAGGKVVAPPFDVLESGRMAVFQDPNGAFFAVWQPKDMAGFEAKNAPGSYAWAELTSGAIDKAKAFYKKVFGWAERTTPMGDGNPPYTEFLHEGQSILGAWDMAAMPHEMPSAWLIYFAVDDVDTANQKALSLGAKQMMEAQDFPGGRFSIVIDPQGAGFGLLKMAPR
jgi:predicted enzyme related to lactoylglutathione lyase